MKQNRKILKKDRKTVLFSLPKTETGTQKERCFDRTLIYNKNGLKQKGKQSEALSFSLPFELGVGIIKLEKLPYR